MLVGEKGYQDQYLLMVKLVFNMKKNYKTITINIELTSFDDLSEVSSDVIQNITKEAIRTVKNQKKMFKENKIKLEYINVRQFPIM
jgi:hypothetical protein